MNAGFDEATYRREVARIVGQLNALGPVGWAPQRAQLAEGVANLHRHFGAPEADEWYRTALNLYEIEARRPLAKIALLFWKLGDSESCHKESQAVLEKYSSPLERIAEASDMGDKERVVYQCAVAYLLLVEWGALKRLCETAIACGLEKREPYILHALGQIAHGKGTGEEDAVRRGLAQLRGFIEAWPTGGSALHEDVFRVVEREATPARE